jgi:hypothetical protein
MYPDYLYALARQHHEDLLRHQHFRRRRDSTHPRHPRGPTSVGRTRRSLGTALVVVGTRLLGGASAHVELFDSRR